MAEQYRVSHLCGVGEITESTGCVGCGKVTEHYKVSQETLLRFV